MLFNSTVFAQFFAAFLFLYWLVRHHLRARNILIVLASYLFYGWWDYRFLALLIASSVIDYFVALGLATPDPKRRKLLLLVSVTFNLAMLGFFKYYDFFITSFAELLQQLNVTVNLLTLNILLPMGISFYTFQTMSYTIDVYRGEIKPTRSLVNFLAYVSFFPQLVAGPIERARHLLPQFERTLVVTLPMIETGIWFCLWGLFKKVVVADNLAPLVDLVYNSPTYTGPAVILGTIAFALQIYCDFSGYSDIARGLAKILGFDLMVNFDRPYAATSIRDFWRRWHISLSTWLRDYLYLSLGGNRKGRLRTYVNLMVTMVLGGLWHGAAANFVLWGIWHGLGLVGHRLLTSGKQTTARPEARAWTRPLGWLATISFVLYGWLLFRARSLPQIGEMTAALMNFEPPMWLGSYLINLIVFATPLVIGEVLLGHPWPRIAPRLSIWWVRAVVQGVLLLAIVMFWEKRHVPFIYFQF